MLEQRRPTLQARMERWPVVGKRLRRNREAAEQAEVLGLTRQVAGMVSEQLARQAVVTRFTAVGSDQPYLECHTVGLEGLGERRLAVNVWIAHEEGILHEYEDGPELASHLRIAEQRGLNEENRFMEINRTKENETTLAINVYPPLNQKPRAVITDAFSAIFPAVPLSQNSQVAFLNDILMSGFDEGYTEELLDHAQKAADLNNDNPTRVANYTVSIIRNNPNAPIITI